MIIKVNCQQSGQLSFSSRLRREIVALLRYDLLASQKNDKKENILITKLQSEKIMRSNTTNIPLANQFLMYLQIFIIQVRFALLKSNSSEDIKALWIIEKENQWRKETLQKYYQTVRAEFDPILDFILF